MGLRPSSERSSTSSSGAPDPTPCRADSPGAPTTPELPPLIVIAGATATGKTALAIELARELQGAEIVSADSRQVYRGMDIATAKPTTEQLTAAPHHCLDLVDPDERFTAADYQHHAHAALTDIARRGGLALLTGGTGLYLRAVARGMPLGRGDADADTRAALEARYEDDGLEPLVAELSERDPAGAVTVDTRNPRRVIRALERAIVSGSATPPPPTGYPAPVRWLGLVRERTEHRRAIADRIDEQFEAGLLAEAERLRGRFGEDLPAFSAMGYREAFDVLDGRCDIDEAKARDGRRTWAYARRQLTWFRSEPGITTIAAGEGALAAARSILARSLREVAAADYAGADESH